MVNHWNTEPSTAQNCAPLPGPTQLPCKFTETTRFARDGTTREDRIPNFLNGKDGQLNELHPKRVDVNTNTHTTYEDRLVNTRSVLELADEVEKSLWSPPALKSRRAKSATSKTLLSNDTRFELLQEPFAEPIGPGHYWIEGGKPDLGPLPACLASRSASPSKDPSRISASFISPPRGRLWPLASEAPARVYVQPGYVPEHDKTVPWALSHDQRTSVTDYRYAARVNDARREVPIDAEYSAHRVMDSSAKLVKVADQAAVQKTAAKVPFMSNQPRFVELPKERLNDQRLSRQRSDKDPAALGPGSYAPLISLGAAKKQSYRMFAPKQPNGILAPVSPPPWASRTHWGSNQAHQGVGGMGPSASFQSSPRSRKYGPFTWATDSSLTRTL